MPRRSLALLAMAVLVVLAACDGDGAAVDYRPGDPFYLEATVHVEDSRPGGGESVTDLRWWWQDARHFRQEIDPQGRPAGLSVLLREGGDRVVYYQEGSGTYTYEDVPPGLDGGVYPFPISVLLGPLDYDSVEAFIEAWEDMPSIEYAQRSGAAEVVGREVEVVEYGPTWRSSSSDGGEESGGTGRIYVDPETMMALRNEVDGEGSGQAYRVEVTLLDVAPEFEDGLFEFVPPPGASEAGRIAASAMAAP